MKKINLDLLLIATLIITSCIIYYTIVSLTYNLAGFNIIENDFVRFVIGANKTISFFTPFIIFTFFFITSKMMLIFYDIEVKNITIWEIISISFTPIFFNYLFFLYIVVDMTENNIIDYKNKTYFNYTVSSLEEILSYIWVLFYIIFIIKLIQKLKIPLLNSIIISTTPTLLLLLFKYLISVNSP